MAVRGFDVFSLRSIGVGASGLAQTRGSFGKAALALTASAAALTLAGTAFAQETQLPGINVQGAQAKKASAPKSKPKPKPVQAAQSEPVSPSSASGGEGVAPSDVPYNTPAGISVVTASDLSTYGGTNLDNALRSQPGTYTRTNPQNAGLAVNIRGFEGSGRVNTLIDGVQQNFGFTGHEAQGFTYIDPGLVAGIDVSRGAVTTAGGTGALAGVANLRTLDVEDILRPGQNIGGFVTTTWGSNNVGFSETAAAAVQTRGIGIAGAISHRDPGNYQNGAGVEIPETGQDLTSGLFKVNLRPTEDQTLRFGGVIYDNDFFANSYNQNVRQQTYTAKYAYNPVGNDLIDFRLNGYYNDVAMKYGTDATPTSGGSGTIPNQGLRLGPCHRRYRSWLRRLEYLALLPWRHSCEVGVRLRILRRQRGILQSLSACGRWRRQSVGLQIEERGILRDDIFEGHLRSDRRSEVRYVRHQWQRHRTCGPIAARRRPWPI